ncbi:hypothetical protein V5O48_012397 [Marasmius crinis-equi]|uniref:Uncharacterized protein n=1 Tax=Marasmius crinis-equi TaxID=585013 RepID=A0ABR3F368_9AGAR
MAPVKKSVPSNPKVAEGQSEQRPSTTPLVPVATRSQSLEGMIKPTINVPSELNRDVSSEEEDSDVSMHSSSSLEDEKGLGSEGMTVDVDYNADKLQNIDSEASGSAIAVDIIELPTPVPKIQTPLRATTPQVADYPDDEIEKPQSHSHSVTVEDVPDSDDNEELSANDCARDGELDREYGIDWTVEMDVSNELDGELLGLSLDDIVDEALEKELLDFGGFFSYFSIGGSAD